MRFKSSIPLPLVRKSLLKMGFQETFYRRGKGSYRRENLHVRLGRLRAGRVVLDIHRDYRNYDDHYSKQLSEQEIGDFLKLMNKIILGFNFRGNVSWIRVLKRCKFASREWLLGEA